MAGYLYCMRNSHSRYGKYVKLGFTERMPEVRVRELSLKWRCAFELLWDIPVYDAKLSEFFLHEHFRRFWIAYEFFQIDASVAKEAAEQLLDEHWREIEGLEVIPSVSELAGQAADGILLEPQEEQPCIPELGIVPNYGPDSDTE